MISKKKTKVSRIERRMNDINDNLKEIETISRVMLESLSAPENLRIYDSESRSMLLQTKVSRVRRYFERISHILNIGGQ